MISIYQRTLKQKGIKAVEEIRPGVWVHTVSPASSELEVLAKEHNLEFGHLQDAIDIYESPRLEVEDGVVYIFTRVPSKGRADVGTIPFTIIVHSEFVLTVAHEQQSFITPLLKEDSKIVTTQKVKLALLLLSEINQKYLRSITAIRKEVNRLKVYPENVTEKEILRFIELESDVNEYLNALIPMRLIFTKLGSGNVLSLFEDDKDLVEDLQLGVEQLIDGAKTILRTIVNIREAYSVVATNRLNGVIRVLTTLTVLLTIPTIVTSFFGMNVMLPLADDPRAPGLILFGTFALVGVLVLILRNRKWL